MASNAATPVKYLTRVMLDRRCGFYFKRLLQPKVHTHLKSLGLDKAMKKTLVDVLLPAVYLKLHAAKAGTADIKKQREAREASAAVLYHQLSKAVI